MKKTIKIIIFLLFVTPAIAEILTGSTPLLEFFNPFVLLMMLLIYGCGALLIREAKARWKLQWSVILLTIAYGILEEGTIVQSFFNTSWGDLDALSGYGMFFGVQWPWAIMLTVFHATVSTLIPITIAGYLWPKYKNTPLLKKKGIFLSFLGIIAATLFWMITIESGQNLEQQFTNYIPNYFLVIGSLLVVVLLSWLAYVYRNSRISINRKLHSPFFVGFFAFLFQMLNFITPSLLANLKVPGILTILIQLILTAFFVWIIVLQLFNKKATKKHITAFVIGSLLFWILFSPVIELIGGLGTIAVAVILLIFLIFWRRKVLKNKEVT